jgi:PAS domain S-box-containing protein
MWDITEHKQAELLQNAVYHISRAADKSASLNDLFKSVHEIISTVMPAKNFYISLYDDKNNLISFPYFVDEFDAPPPPTKPRKGLTEYVLRTGRSLLCDDAADRELRHRGEVELLGAPSSIWLGVPLTVDNKTIGVMVVQHYSDPNAYGHRELRMLEYVSSQIAKSIERKRAEDAIRRQVVFDTFLNKLLARFANSAGAAIDNHIRPGLQEIGQFMGADDVFVLLTSSDSARWSAVYDWHVPGSPDWLQKYQDVPMGTLPWTEKRLLGGKMIQISALDDLPPEAAAERQKYEMEGLKSLVEVPLRARGGFVIGWIGLRSYTHQIHWSREDVLWLQIFGDGLANVLERKRAEEALEFSEKKYRNLVENALVGIYQTDIKGHILYVNDALAKMLEFESPQEMTQRSTLEVYKNLKDRKILLENLMKQGKATAFDIEFLTKTGKTKTILLSATLDGDILSGMIEDITERKQAEADLRESEKRYRELFDNVPVGLYRTTPGGKTLDANPALLRMLGYPDRESILKANTVTDYENPEDRERWKTALEKTGVLEDFEYKNLRRDGKVIWVKDSARVVKDAKGRVLYYEGALVDFTERKKAEEELSYTVEMLRKNLGATIQAISTLVETRTLIQRDIKDG